MTTATTNTAYDVRLEIALARAGLSRGQLWKIAKLQPGNRSITPAAWFIVKIAKILGCDARWLARGIQSPAAIATVEQLRELRLKEQGNFHKMTAADFGAICNHFRLDAQPPVPSPNEPTCRYCGCTEFNACPSGCSWLDKDQTICSACLEAGDET